MDSQDKPIVLETREKSVSLSADKKEGMERQMPKEDNC